MPNWDVLWLLALETWYKCKILQLAVLSENIAMGRSISKIFWNGVNWGHWARTKCDESFAVLYMKLFWHFWELLWLFSMFWIRTPSQTSKKWRNWFSFYSFDTVYKSLFTYQLKCWKLQHWSARCEYSAFCKLMKCTCFMID